MNYHSDYFLPEDVGIKRKGIFHCLLEATLEDFQWIPHVRLASFSAFQNYKTFYRIASNTHWENGKILLFINIHPSDSPIELLCDFLRFFKKSFLISKEKLLVHLNYQIEVNNPSAQAYLKKVFELFVNEFGFIPEQLSSFDIGKMESFENILVIEAGSEWNCLDNYLVHAVLAKGGTLFQHPRWEVLRTERKISLSPFHSLEFVSVIDGHYSDCLFWKEAKELDLIKFPSDLQLFYQLVYKNIY